MLRGEEKNKLKARAGSRGSCLFGEAEPHVSAQSQQLDDHLHGEDHGEDHVEDVHDGGEELGLLVMLGEETQEHSDNGSPVRTVGKERGEAVPGRPA